MAEGYLLSAASIRQLQADHRALRAAITRLERQIAPTTNNAPDWGREWWWGVLTKRDGDTYPVPPANAYTVRLASRTFDPTTPGNATLTDADSDPKQLVTARAMHHGHMPEGLYVLLLRTGSTDGERWWILPPQTPLRRAIAQEAIASGGSGEVQIQDGLGNDDVADAYNDWGASPPAVADEAEIVVWWDVSGSKWRVLSGGTAAAAPRARCVIVSDYNYITSNICWREGEASLSAAAVIGNDGVDDEDVKLFPSMLGNLTNADGNVFAVEDSPAAYADNWLTLQQDGQYRVIAVFTWQLATLSAGDAETHQQDAGHLHTAPGGVTSTVSAGAQALLHYLCVVNAQILVDDSPLTEGRTGYSSMFELLYTSESSERVQVATLTLVTHILRDGVDKTVDLRWSMLAQSPYSQANHFQVAVTVEQISDS
jgi:hypothetical protein